MKIEIRKVDKERGIVQITCPDERWYPNKPIEEIDNLKLLSQEDFYPSSSWISSYYPKGPEYVKWVADKGWDKAEEIKNLSGEKGTRVHHACEALLLGDEVKMDSKFSDGKGEVSELNAEEYWTVMTFRRFLEEERPILLTLPNSKPAIEYTVLNHIHGYGGTIDFKCLLKSDGYKFVHIVDIKTSANVYPSHEIQISSYKEADPDCEKIDILQVGYRRNKVGFKLTPIEPQFDVFLAARTIWKKEQGNVLVPQREYPLSLTWEPIKEVPAPIGGLVKILTGPDSVQKKEPKKKVVVRKKVIKK